MERSEILQLLLYAGEVFPTLQLPTTRERVELRVQVWAEHLEDLPQPVVHAALTLPEWGDFCPSPARLRVAALRLAGADLAPDADEAVAEIMRAIHKLGWQRVPEWSHPAVAGTVEAFGGWLALCESEHPESLRAHLLKLYGTAAHRHARTETMAPAVLELLAGVLPAIEDHRPAELPVPDPEPVEDRDDAACKAAMSRVREEVRRARAARQ